MKRTARTWLKTLSLLLLSSSLAGCFSDDPERSSEYAVQGLYSAALSPSGEYALVGSIQHGGSYWKTDVDERRYNWNHAEGDFTPHISVDIDPSAAFAITASARTMVLWNTLTGRPEWFWNTPGDVKSVKLNRNGDYALIGLDDQTARYFDVKQGGIKQTFRTGAIVRSVDVDDAGTLALTGDDNYQVILWDIETGNIKHQWTLSNRIASVTISADGRYAFGAAQLGNAKIWSTETGEEVQIISTGALANRKVTISKAEFSPDNRYLLIGGINRDVRLVSITTGDILRHWSLTLRDQLRPTGASVLALAFGNDGTYFAIGSNGLFNELK